MKITSDDVKAGKVLPHLIENNIWVPASLRTNTLTAQEHYNSLKASDRKELYPNGWRDEDEAQELVGVGGLTFLPLAGSTMTGPLVPERGENKNE